MFLLTADVDGSYFNEKVMRKEGTTGVRSWSDTRRGISKTASPNHSDRDPEARGEGFSEAGPTEVHVAFLTLELNCFPRNED